MSKNNTQEFKTIASEQKSDETAKLLDKLWQEIADLKSENNYLKSGIEFYKKKADEYEILYLQTDKQLQGILKEMV